MGPWNCDTCGMSFDSMGGQRCDCGKPQLYDYKTGEHIRPATAEELRASQEQEWKDGGRGVIKVDGHSCYVVE